MGMPELPEVEVIRRGLEPLVCGKTFDRPQLIFSGSVRYPAPGQFCEEISGRRVTTLHRHGKYLLVEMDRGILVVHLRMTGRLVYLEHEGPPPDYLRVRLPFTDRSLLYFSDMRKFGGLWLLESRADLSRTGMHRLGPDIYEQISQEQFVSLFNKRRRARIKPLLLDQHFVAGLGNIYVDESLFRSGIHPCREAASLSREEIEALFQSIRDLLKEAICCGGSSSRDYRDALGERGAFQERFFVYGRKGYRCSCGAVIERIVVAGRGTHYCPGCQVRGEQ
jgi:formamidopyrimidine-DNA glycosylase